MAETRQLIIERTVHAPIACVWKALADYECLKQWCPFFPDFRPEVGFETQFMLGPDDQHQYRHHVRVVEVKVCRSLCYTWDYGGMSPQSSVSFELLASGSTATRVILTCSIDPLPDDQVDFMKNASAGWNYLASKLKNSIEVKE